MILSLYGKMLFSQGGKEDDYRLFRIQGAILWTTAGYAVLVKKVGHFPKMPNIFRNCPAKKYWVYLALFKKCFNTSSEISSWF
jgi:hypothetical protein